MLDAVERDGQPAEAAWPYLPTLPVDLEHWAPPTNIDQLFHARGLRSAGNVVGIRAEIERDRPVLIVMSVSDAFYYGFDNDGVIDSDEPLDPMRVHALIAVGHGRRGSGALTLVRNSWGEHWGISGHAWLSDRYLAPRILETAVMRKVT